MSDTPKVDAFLKEMLTEHEQKNYNDFDHYFFGMRDLSGFARDLERQMNRRASEDLLAALKELVRLKDIKERIERGSELNGEWTDYEVNKEWAWQAARAAIVRYE